MSEKENEDTIGIVCENANIVKLIFTDNIVDNHLHSNTEWQTAEAKINYCPMCGRKLEE